MRSKSRAVSVLLAVAASLAAFAPSASAVTPPNCEEDHFCVWSVWVNPGNESAVPTVNTDTDWSGDATAFRVYNGTGRYALVEYNETLADGSVRNYESCFGGLWNYFTRTFTVTGVTFHDERPPSQQYC
jgi:hypothetical protein